MRSGSGMETRKWLRNVGFATRATLGVREQTSDRGCVEREVGGEKLENKRKKEDKHKQGRFEDKDKDESVDKKNCPLSSSLRKTTRPKSNSMPFRRRK